MKSRIQNEKKTLHRIIPRRRWLTGRATVEPIDPARLRQFNFYARMGPKTLGIDPILVKVDLD